MTSTIEEVETIDHLDFDPPCINNDICGNDAAWAVKLKCCSQRYLMCDPCYDQYTIRGVYHAPCDKHTLPPTPFKEVGRL